MSRRSRKKAADIEAKRIIDEDRARKLAAAQEDRERRRQLKEADRARRIAAGEDVAATDRRRRGLILWWVGAAVTASLLAPFAVWYSLRRRFTPGATITLALVGVVCMVYTLSALSSEDAAQEPRERSASTQATPAKASTVPLATRKKDFTEFVTELARLLSLSDLQLKNYQSALKLFSTDPVTAYTTIETAENTFGDIAMQLDALGVPNSIQGKDRTTLQHARDDASASAFARSNAAENAREGIDDGELGKLADSRADMQSADSSLLLAVAGLVEVGAKYGVNVDKIIQAA